MTEPGFGPRWSDQSKSVVFSNSTDSLSVCNNIMFIKCPGLAEVLYDSHPWQELPGDQKMSKTYIHAMNMIDV